MIFSFEFLLYLQIYSLTQSAFILGSLYFLIMARFLPISPLMFSSLAIHITLCFTRSRWPPHCRLNVWTRLLSLWQMPKYLADHKRRLTVARGLRSLSLWLVGPLLLAQGEATDPRGSMWQGKCVTGEMCGRGVCSSGSVWQMKCLVRTENQRYPKQHC